MKQEKTPWFIEIEEVMISIDEISFIECEWEKDILRIEMCHTGSLTCSAKKYAHPLFKALKHVTTKIDPILPEEK